MIVDMYTETVCDMCGAHPTVVVRVTPSVETDLCATHQWEFAQLVAPYIRAGRVAPTPPPPTSTEIRKWAKHAMPWKTVKPSGRIPQDVVEAYHAATR